MTAPQAAPVVLVTGAAAGMGLATARQLLASGHRVGLLDIDEPALERAWPEPSGDRALKIVADVSDDESAQSAVGRILAAFGRLDALVNNAALHGSSWSRPCLSYTAAQWTQLFSVNVFGIVTMVRAAAPALADTRGTIVNISSMVAYGYGPPSAYAVSKSAVNGLTAFLANELGPAGIRVVGLAPGFIATPALLDGLDEQVKRELLNDQAVDIQGGPQEIAEITEFLVSPAARMISGHTVIADAGITRRP
jgi:3-oxoacyl-[acyl-carrier protein] reductase